MIAGAIFAVSVLMLLQFFVLYSRSVIAESRGHVLSEETGKILGVSTNLVRGDQFQRLLQLTDLCPEVGGDANRLRVVSTYYRLLGLLRLLSSWATPQAARWIDSERGGCTHVAAVVLDRRIAYNRMLAAQQASESL